MNLLHISSDYPYTSLYEQLLKSLSGYPEFSQTMYVPLSRRAGEFPDQVPLTPTATIVYSKDFGDVHRAMYHRKRLRIHKQLLERLEPAKFDLVHAHYLFSAGGVAYELFRQSSLPYIVSVRSTDVNIFFKRMVHLRTFGLETMRAAQRVVFLSPAHRDLVLDRYVPTSLRSELATKAVSIPNGVHESWLQEQDRFPRHLEEGKLRLIFVGEFSRNKNIETIIAATKQLRGLGVNASLRLVGKGSRKDKIMKLVKRDSRFLTIDAWTTSREALRSAYRSADVFVMPSFHETFGMVYVEAMSQGLPIIYTKGQGIDGYFDTGSVGYAVDPRNVDDIVAKILRIRAEYEQISSNSIEHSQEFSWEHVAGRLRQLYEDAQHEVS